MAVATKYVPVEAYWSVGIIKRAYVALRRVYEIIQEELPTVSKDATLQMAFKAVNDSSSLEGLVPTLLLFRAFPQITELDPLVLSITQRATAIRRAIAEVEKVRSKIQVNNVLNTRNGLDTQQIYNLTINSEVLVQRENGKQEGPFKLINITGETYTLLLLSGLTDFRSTIVKLFFRREG